MQHGPDDHHNEINPDLEAIIKKTKDLCDYIYNENKAQHLTTEEQKDQNTQQMGQENSRIQNFVMILDRQNITGMIR